MRHLLLGNTGLRVSEIALGTMTFGTEWGHGADEAEAAKIFETYAQAGGTFIDTAVNYTEGTSEKMLGTFLRADRERFVVASKFGFTTDPSQTNAGGSHRKSLRNAVHTSLSRLGTDYLDILYVHFWDHHTPIEETVRALDDLVRAGDILYTGISDSPAWVVARAQTYCEQRALTPFAVVQAPYSLIDRGVETELLPAVDAFGLTFTAWSVLARGMLTGKYNDATPSDARLSDAGAPNERELTIARAVADIARTIGATPAQVATAWAMHLGWVVPVIGARTATQLADSLGAADLTLDVEQLALLDKVSAPAPAYPTAMLRGARPAFLGPVLESTRSARRFGVLPGT